MRRIYKFIRNDEAATAVEYAVMMAMILMAVIAAVGAVGEQTGGMWGGIVSDLDAVGF
jgi:pilus assembly protein Flp/PilA